MTARWDAVVVGARVAGASTALLLARAGLRVLCVDRSRRGSDTVSTHALMRAGVLQLSRWGLLDAVRQAGTPPIHRTTFHYGSETVSITMRPSPGVDALYAPRRTLLDDLLVDAAGRAGAEFRHGTAVTGLVRGPGGRVSGVTLRDRHGGQRTEQAALVIGADGRESLVADAVAAPTVFAGRAATAVVYGYWADLPVDGYTWAYGPAASSGAIPTNDGLTCVFGGGRPERVAALVRGLGPAGALRELTGAGPLGPRLGTAPRIGGVRYVRGTPGHLRRPYGPGWALVGDAGYWKDPLSTHGMTAALRDAELLAGAVIAAPRPGREQLEALCDYARCRDELSLPMLRVVEKVAAHDWDMAGIRSLLMEMSSTMVDEVELLEGLPDAA
ncbi:NAD(P)/FAD-dependent oxidoreductase [Blastococcus deserti]|uniref:NAD(P)/FAD-dependent oxidoreductase n=1 Tax=Blastococcus deserti TaxID=2259033 RepID=A0ABW4XFD1_9ACTN